MGPQNAAQWAAPDTCGQRAAGTATFLSEPEDSCESSGVKKFVLGIIVAAF
jgi:hypothetical protein